MSKAFIELGPTPCDEICEQVGPNYSADRAHYAMVRYINQLEKMFPQWETVGCKFRTKSFPHDFGTYSEVIVIYDPDNADQVAFAFMVEANLPSEWTD